MARADEWQLLAPGLCCWEVYDPKVKSVLNSTGVRTPEGWVFLDPVPLAPTALAELAELGPTAAIVLTNGNHERAATAFCKALGAPLLMHAAAQPEITVPATRFLQPGELVGGELRVLDLAGGGAGEIALLSPSGTLHVGDAFINAGSYGFSLLPPKYCSSPKQLRASAEKLLHEEFRVLTFAHGTPITVRAKERLAELLA